jgi:hypothetical protein
VPGDKNSKLDSLSKTTQPKINISEIDKKIRIHNNISAVLYIRPDKITGKFHTGKLGSPPEKPMVVEVNMSCSHRANDIFIFKNKIEAMECKNFVLNLGQRDL